MDEPVEERRPAPEFIADSLRLEPVRPFVTELDELATPERVVEESYVDLPFLPEEYPEFLPPA